MMITLPTDIKSSELNNTNKLAFKLPKIENEMPDPFMKQ